MSVNRYWLLNPSGQHQHGEFIDDTCAQRAAERGMLSRLTKAAAFPRQRVEVLSLDDVEVELNELYYRRGWTDGLPVLAPTLARVDEMLEATEFDRAHVVAELEPLRGLAVVEKLAANAVMAGCRPDHFPVVLAAVQAIAKPEFNLRGVQTTDENVTPAIVVSSRRTSALDVNASFGALGPGWRGGAAIGRAVRLIMQNIGGGWQAAVSLAGLGQPGRGRSRCGCSLQERRLRLGWNALCMLALGVWHALHAERLSRRWDAQTRPWSCSLMLVYHRERLRLCLALEASSCRDWLVRLVHAALLGPHLQAVADRMRSRVAPVGSGCSQPAG